MTTTAKYHLALPLCTQYLYFQDLLVLLEVCKVWQSIVLSRTSHIYVQYSGDSVSGKNESRLNLTRLTQFADVQNVYWRYLDASTLLELDRVRRLSNKVRILTIQHLVMRSESAHTSSIVPIDDTNHPLFSLARNSSTPVRYKLSTLSIYRYNDAIGSLHSHFLHPYRLSLQYIMLENILTLTNECVDSILQECVQLKGLHISMCFLLTQLSLPTNSTHTSPNPTPASPGDGLSLRPPTPQPSPAVLIPNTDSSAVSDIYSHHQHIHVHATTPHTPPATTSHSHPRRAQLAELSITKCPNFFSFVIPPAGALAGVCYLDLSHTRIPTDALSALLAHTPQLRTLYVNHLHSGPPHAHRSHSALEICHARLTALQCMHIRPMRSLRVQCPQLAHLKLSHNSSLTSLHVESAQLARLDLAGLQSLVFVDLLAPRLQALVLCGCCRLFSCPAVLTHLPQPPPHIEAAAVLFDCVERLFHQCPRLPRRRFLDWCVADTPLFALRDQLKLLHGDAGDMDEDAGPGQAQSSQTGALGLAAAAGVLEDGDQFAMQSPQRLSEVRKRNSFA